MWVCACSVAISSWTFAYLWEQFVRNCMTSSRIVHMKVGIRKIWFIQTHISPSPCVYVREPPLSKSFRFAVSVAFSLTGLWLSKLLPRWLWPKESYTHSCQKDDLSLPLLFKSHLFLNDDYGKQLPDPIQCNWQFYSPAIEKRTFFFWSWYALQASKWQPWKQANTKVVNF